MTRWYLYTGRGTFLKEIFKRLDHDCYYVSIRLRYDILEIHLYRVFFRVVSFEEFSRKFSSTNLGALSIRTSPSMTKKRLSIACKMPGVKIQWKKSRYVRHTMCILLIAVSLYDCQSC